MGLRQRRASNMPNTNNALYEFMRQAKRAERLGLGRWIDTYMPRGETTIDEMLRAAYRFEIALDRQEVKS